MKDMEGEQARFRARRSFDYSVLTPDGRRERGSVYVSPSPDAVVRLWVTPADYDAGFDAALHQWVRAWVRKDWPLRKSGFARTVDQLGNLGYYGRGRQGMKAGRGSGEAEPD